MFYIESIDESRTVLEGTVPNKIVEPGHMLRLMDLHFNPIACGYTIPENRCQTAVIQLRRSVSKRELARCGKLFLVGSKSGIKTGACPVGL
ncbi:MAG: hypothetical protein IJ265_00390 [Oscillospiraceae bacterium]|nr:hypothetical protein [Oscillospiraceae bacterium]